MNVNATSSAVNVFPSLHLILSFNLNVILKLSSDISYDLANSGFGFKFLSKLKSELYVRSITASSYVVSFNSGLNIPVGELVNAYTILSFDFGSIAFPDSSLYYTQLKY
ncbi:hypothetical protein Q5M85_14275 [Paraclostridium bifermentans]|nr:hypothetical protein [Paraclostridium bifermentans]